MKTKLTITSFLLLIMSGCGGGSSSSGSGAVVPDFNGFARQVFVGTYRADNPPPFNYSGEVRIDVVNRVITITGHPCVSEVADLLLTRRSSTSGQVLADGFDTGLAGPTGLRFEFIEGGQGTFILDVGQSTQSCGSTAGSTQF